MSAAWCPSHKWMYGNCDTQSHGREPTLIAQCQACDINKSYKKLILSNSWCGSVASVSNGLALGYLSKLNKTSKTFKYRDFRPSDCLCLLAVGPSLRKYWQRRMLFLQEMREMQRNSWCSNFSEKSQFKKNHYKEENKETAAMKLLAP